MAPRELQQDLMTAPWNHMPIEIGLDETQGDHVMDGNDIMLPLE